jgi:glycosyltransferase involved in cell wall biosynthesis
MNFSSNIAERTPSEIDCSPHEARPYVTAVMPCLNEEKTVALCVAKAVECFSRLGLSGEVIVADNGSTDRSVELAKAAGATVVHVKTRGYGAALTAGIKAARGEIIIMGDSDDSYDWANLDGFIEAIEAGNDLVMGNRFRGGIQKGAMPPLHRYFGNPVLSLISRLAFNVSIGDFHCGMRAFTSNAFSRMELYSSGMEFATEMVASAAKKGLKVAEIPIRLYPDKRDREPHLRSFRDGWRHLRFILSHAPDHVFMWPGITMLLLGVTTMALLVSGPRTIGNHYFGVHFIVLGSMLASIGLNVVSMGVLSKIILGIERTEKFQFIRSLLSHNHLIEGIFTTGAACAAIGFTTDLMLLLRWMKTTSGMDDSVHLAVAASTILVIGIEVMFFAFLVFLARERHERDFHLRSSNTLIKNA